MKRFIVALVVACLGIVGFTASAAQAVANPGSCTLGTHGVVTWNVNESPSEGSVTYISLKSPVRLNIGAFTSSNTRYYAYKNDGASTATRGNGIFYSSPIDGDGYWNYRADPDYNATGFGYDIQIGRIYIVVNHYGTTASCASSTYI